MRRNPGYCEQLLWAELRGRKLCGFKFKRQHLISGYIVDFVCLEMKLVVELDGGIHKLKREGDSIRDAVLQTLGYRVLRFGNEEFLRDISLTLRTISRALNFPSPPR